MPTRTEFIASIRKKYPVYNNRGDDELYDAIMAKYPVYKDPITEDVPEQPLPGFETVRFNDDAGLQKTDFSQINYNISFSISE